MTAHCPDSRDAPPRSSSNCAPSTRSNSKGIESCASCRERRKPLYREEQDLSVLFVYALIDSLQQTQNMTLQLLPTCTSTKGNSCLNQQQEVTRLVQSGAARVHSAKHICHMPTHNSAKKPRQAQVHHRLPPTKATTNTLNSTKKNFERRHEGNSLGFCFLLFFFVVVFSFLFFSIFQVRDFLSVP